MQFSRWDAQGNVYLLTEQELSADSARAAVGDTDGILQIVTRDADSAEIVIWNPDGSTAELSGNGTRIAARWLARETGADVVRIRVGPREVVARMLAGDEVEQDLGEVEVFERERVAGLDVTGAAPVEYRGYVPPRSVVVAGTRAKEFPSGTYQLSCALIIGQRKESTDLRTSLNETLREFELGA